MKAELEAVLHPLLGEVAVENLTTLTGGASRTTWAFDAVTADTRHPLILRTGPPDEVHAGMELEARAQQRRPPSAPVSPHPDRGQQPCGTGQSVSHLRGDRG